MNLDVGELTTNGGGHMFGANITYINPRTKWVVLEDGEVIQISRLLDDDGDATDVPEEAVACVAGPDSEGMWYSIDLSWVPTIH